MASLAADENSGEIQRIMGLGRILCSWGFAFKWVAISAEALRRFIMSLQPAACLWIKNVAWNQRSELSLFCQVCWDKMLPALLALSVSLSPSRGTCRGSWTPSPLPDELLPWELLSLGDPLMLPTQPQSHKQTQPHTPNKGALNAAEAKRTQTQSRSSPTLAFSAHSNKFC